MSLRTPLLPNKHLHHNQFGISRLLASIILVFWLVLLSVVALNRQYLFDSYELHGYNAPSTIAQLASQDGMTSSARKIFYVNHPSIDSRSTFQTECPQGGGEKTIVLGCYHSNQRGIFLLSVSDPILDGVEQVTAAHEMLHAAYDRLSSSERKHVDAMLQDYYEHDLTDSRIKQTLADYQKSEPGQQVNEMHSIFGTEVANLPAPLEAYYQKYFTNRKLVTAFSAQYEAAFTSREAQVSADDAQLASLKALIDQDEAQLKTELATLNAQQAQLQSERSSGNISAYNAGVPAYNQLVAQYNALVHTVQTLVGQYNSLVNSRNAIALEEQQLESDLSGAPTTIKQ